MSAYRGAVPVAELRRLWARGWSQERIAAALGRPLNTVVYAARRLGMGAWRKRRKWSTADSDRLAAMWTAGATLADIAMRLRCNISQVSNHRRRMGLPARQAPHRAFTRAEEAVIEANWRDASLAQIGALIGRSPRAVSEHAICKLGLPHRWTIGLATGRGRSKVPRSKP